MNPLDVLLRYPLFALAPEELVHGWLARGHRQRLAVGETVFPEGSAGHWGYVLLRGRVRILRSIEGKDESVGSIHAGELFGEYALLPPGLNTATCRVAGDADLLQFPLEPVRAWIETAPAVQRALKSWLQLHFLVRRLRAQAFRGFMSDASALAMRPHLERLETAPMRTLQADGLCDDRWFFIESGEVLLSIGAAPARLLGAGACLGEAALLGGGAPITATATQPARCLSLSRASFLSPHRPATALKQTYAGEALAAPARMHWIGQREARDCGAAALAMIAHYLEVPATLDEIRGRLQAGPRGLALVDLLHVAHALGLEGQAVHINAPQLAYVHLPAIAHLTHGHYVVLFSINQEGVRLGDPASGLVNVSILHFLGQFSGFLLLLHWRRPPDLR